MSQPFRGHTRAVACGCSIDCASAETAGTPDPSCLVCALEAGMNKTSLP